MCLELALEGERLCKSGDCRAGVAFFQAAIQAGTDDLRTLSAIYSQLGNAYFYLGDYTKAMQYHKHDLTLARSMNDKLGEAKSSGNLGNTLKVMGRFDEAAIFCQRHLAIAQSLGDRLSEGRALYNLGNVYHAKGKQLGQKDPGDFSDEVKESLMQAVDYYQQNLTLMKDLGDRGAQGRACGNLGNTYYLLGNFETAIEHHQERLRIAREFGDKAAERRANSNLGNSHIFLGQFEQAANHYKRTLSLAMELGERAVEAQACYSLGNTYTLLRDFPTAIDYHQRHLAIAQELGDRIGEARACWSLGNAHSSIGNHEKALHYANSHYLLAKELGDVVGENTAKMNISDLRKILGLPEVLPVAADAGANNQAESDTLQELQSVQGGNKVATGGAALSKQYRVRRQSMEQLDLIKLTPDGKKMVNTQDKHPLPPSSLAAQQQKTSSAGGNQNENIFKNNDEDFFELLTRSQSKRMDDQRCTLKVRLTHAESVDSARKPLTQHNSNNAATTAAVVKENRNALLEMIADFQSERMDEQRALLPGLKRISLTNASSARPNVETTTDGDGGVTAAGPDQEGGVGVVGTPPDDAFLDMLMRCQGSRIEEQRSELPTPNITMDAEAGGERRAAGNSNSGATVPDEDFFSLIMRLQGGRMEDQRATVPLNSNSNSSNNNRSNVNNNNVSVSSTNGTIAAAAAGNNHPNGNGNNQNANASGNGGKGLK
uniref:Putative g-alpha gtpase interaction protein n=1 Tax=Culex tarsalis TaxID=7177 RepID=A0A1Q3FAH9_CULTA